MITNGNKLIIITQNGDVFGHDVSGRNIGPAFKFTGSKAAFNGPVDRFVVTNGNRLIVTTQNGDAFGHDVSGRDIGPPFPMNRSAASLIRGVLLTGKFRAQQQLNKMSADDQRNTLIVEMAAHSNQSVRNYQSLNDATLAGVGAVMVFLREARIRDDAALKKMSADDQRNTLIVEIGAQTGLGRELQSLSNMDLVLLGLGKEAQPGVGLTSGRISFIRGVLLAGKFRTQQQLNKMSADDQRNTLIVEMAAHSNQSVRNYQSLNDATLAGVGAVMVFLREARIRDDAALKKMSADDQRNTMIVEMNAQTQLGSRLQGLNNMDLVRAALGVDISAVIAEHEIEQKYRQIGGRQSLLGRSVKPGLTVQSNGQGFFRDFKGGQIKFSSEGGISAFVTHQTFVVFKGIHCFGKSEAVDEPYAIVGVYALDAQNSTVTKKFPLDRDSYEDFVASTDQAETSIVSPETRGWAPQSLVIVSTVMEHDSGSPDEAAAKVEAAMNKVAVAAAAVGVPEVSVVIGIMDELGIPGLISDLFGMGDDLIGTQSLAIDANELFGIAKRPMQKFGNIEFNFESPLLSDGDASYKLYYEVFIEEFPVPIRLP